LTTASDDYLKTIFHLTRGSLRAGTKDIADMLHISQASVSAMLQKLAIATPPLVDYRKHAGATLTSHGERRALEVIRHHRLLETFLFRTLGYSWDEVHEEACRLEHVISEHFEERLAHFLGNPTHDPHGDPIPDGDLNMSTPALTQLSELQPGDHATIRRVSDTDPDLLRYLGVRAVLPDRRIFVMQRSEYDHILTLRVEGRKERVMLGPLVTQRIYVET